MHIDWNMTLTTAVISCLVVIVSGLIAGLGYLYKSEKERRKEIERQLSEHKYEVYMAVMDLFTEAIDAAVAGTLSTREERIVHTRDLCKKLIIYGSDDVVTSYQKLMDALLTEAHDSTKLAPAIGNVILSIRRDMGNPRTKLTLHEALHQFALDIREIGEKQKI